jgi:hypothetical protein
MIIPINEQYRIASDAYQWAVQKRRARNNKEDWESQTYHPSVDAAVRSLGERMVRESKTQTLVDALEAVGTIATTLSQALTPSIEEVSQTIEGLTKNQTRTDISPKKPTCPAEANHD